MSKWEPSFIRKTIKLLTEKEQEYFIDPNPDAHIAEVRNPNKKICVNNRFENLSNNEKLAVIYHELGHSKFKRYDFFSEIANIFLTFSVLLILFSFFFLIFNFIFNISLFNLSSLIWFIFILCGICFFFFYMFVFWFLEIIADINSCARIDKKHLIKIIENEYSSKKIGFWRRNIIHPPWRLRKKIMDGLD